MSENVRSTNNSQVPKGFKQTEVGLIPEDWNIEKLGNIGKWLSGGTPSKSNDSFWNGVIPWVSAKDMKSPRLKDSIDRVTQNSIGNGTRLIPKRTLLMVVRGMILAHSFPVAITLRNMAFNQDIKALIVREDIDSEFILGWLQANAAKFISIASEATHGTKRIPSNDLFAEKIAIPPLAEQEAIARTLSDTDALIEALEQLIAKKRHIKQGAMQELLTGKKRLPGFGGEWIETTLGKICNHIIDGTHYTPKYVDSGVPFYSVETITENNFSDTKFISRDEHQILIKRCKLERGDILMTRIGSLGKTKLIDWNVDASIYVSLALLKLNNKVCSEYVYRYTQSLKFVQDVEQRSLLHAAPKKINLDQISGVPIKIPVNEEEQRSIATILSDMDAEIAALETKLAKTRQLKQGMMHELLTGRIRLVEPIE